MSDSDPEFRSGAYDAHHKAKSSKDASHDHTRARLAEAAAALKLARGGASTFQLQPINAAEQAELASADHAAARAAAAVRRKAAADAAASAGGGSYWGSSSSPSTSHATAPKVSSPGREEARMLREMFQVLRPCKHVLGTLICGPMHPCIHSACFGQGAYAHLHDRHASPPPRVSCKEGWRQDAV